MLQVVGLVVLLFAWSAQGQQSCTCNLITGVCEVNCCCDIDCDATDVASFSICMENQFNSPSQLCVRNQVVFNNNPNVADESRQNDLYCIVEDTFLERNFYTNPPCIAPNTCFDNLDPLIQTVTPLTDATLGETYRAGDAIVIEYTSGARSFLSTAAAGVSASCENYNPVQFLFPRSDSCSRHITDLGAACAQNSVLDFMSYSNFIVLSTPNSTSMNNTATMTSNCVINGTSTACVNATQSAGNTCNNGVLAVTYTIITNGTNGISAVEISIVLGVVAPTDLPLTQTYSVSFRTNANSAPGVTPRVRSGNPGYLVGWPVLASQVTDGNANPNNNIFLINPNPDGSGTCTNIRQPLLFGQDQRTGCRVPFSIDCAALQQSINDVLDNVIFSANAPTPNIAKFGNVDSSSFNQSKWLPVTRGTNSASPASTSTGCTGMVLSVRYDISYADTGSVTNPQPEIIAVRHSYGGAEFLPILCPPGTCTQQVEVSTSVNFIDVSETRLSQQRSIPTIEEKFPINFFFPLKNINFNYNASVSIKINFFLLLISTLLSCLL